jgi:hypothetical protein
MNANNFIMISHIILQVTTKEAVGSKKVLASDLKNHTAESLLAQHL